MLGTKDLNVGGGRNRAVECGPIGQHSEEFYLVLGHERGNSECRNGKMACRIPIYSLSPSPRYLFKQQIGDYSRIHFNSGIIYTRLEDHVSASVCYARALNADPYLAVAYFQRAYCYFMQEEFDRAYDEYSAALGVSFLMSEGSGFEWVGLEFARSAAFII